MFKAKAGAARLSGVTAKNMALEKPRAAVGTARGMSMRVSSKAFPRNCLRTSIQAMGSPTRMSITVTMAAIWKEARMASMMRSSMAGSLSTYCSMDPQLVNA